MRLLKLNSPQKKEGKKREEEIQSKLLWEMWKREKRMKIEMKVLGRWKRKGDENVK